MPTLNRDSNRIQDLKAFDNTMKNRKEPKREIGR